MNLVIKLWRKSKEDVLAISVLLSFVLTLSFGTIAIYGRQYFYLAPTAIVSLFVPYFFRKSICKSRLAQKIFRIVSYVIIVSILLFKDAILDGGPIVHCISLSVIGVYTGSFFGLLLCSEQGKEEE